MFTAFSTSKINLWTRYKDIIGVIEQHRNAINLDNQYKITIQIKILGQ